MKGLHQIKITITIIILNCVGFLYYINRDIDIITIHLDRFYVSFYKDITLSADIARYTIHVFSWNIPHPHSRSGEYYKILQR